MGVIGKDFKYTVVPNFLDQGEIDLLTQYTEIMHRTNTKNFDFHISEVGDTNCHGDPVFDSLLLTKKRIMEKTTGLKLLPTYSFWRMYTKYAILRKHKDRPACEISVTVHIGSDGTPWPIYMDDWHSQVFLHYVNAEGPHANEYRDGRAYWGMERNY